MLHTLEGFHGGEFWAGLFSQCSPDRVSDDDGSGTVVSPSRYSIFCNTECPRGLFLFHPSWEDKLQKVAWSSQPQLNPAIEHVSMVVQGIKKADKLSRKPLCEHASHTNSFQVLETYWSVQQERELQTESGVMIWITPIKPPNWMDLWDPLPCQQPSPCLPDVWTHPRSWPDGSPNMAK